MNRLCTAHIVQDLATNLEITDAQNVPSCAEHVQVSNRVVCNQHALQPQPIAECRPVGLVCSRKCPIQHVRHAKSSLACRQWHVSTLDSRVLVMFSQQATATTPA